MMRVPRAPGLIAGGQSLAAAQASGTEARRRSRQMARRGRGHELGGSEGDDGQASPPGGEEVRWGEQAVERALDV